MRWLKNKKLVLFIFVVLFLLTRLPRIWNDEINPDAVNWHYRSQQFVVGLKTLDFEKTYQHYHPGVVLMWVTGIPIEIYKQITGIQFYNTDIFPQFHLVAKLSVVFFQLILTLVLIKVLIYIFDFEKSILIVSLFTFEPFFIGNSRLYHMDIIHTLLIFTGLSLGYAAVKNEDNIKTVFASILLGLAFLTKSVSIIFIAIYFALFLVKTLNSSQVKKYIKSFAISLLALVITVFLLFPALWIKPGFYFAELFREATRIGVRNGHEQTILGYETVDAGYMFYPLVFLIKLSPPLFLLPLANFVIFGVGVYKTFKFKKFTKSALFEKLKNMDYVLFLTIFYLIYFIAMSALTKKIDRYMLVMFPYFAVIIVDLVKKYSKYLYPTIALFWIIPIVTLYPYYFAYTSPLTINSKISNDLVSQKNFGIGIFDLKEYIVSNYSDRAKLGFTDTKPIKSIYPNSRVFDIREYGPGNYDVIVLGIGEEFTDKIVGSGYQFNKVYSIEINGLEYWRIYEKQK